MSEVNKSIRLHGALSDALRNQTKFLQGRLFTLIEASFVDKEQRKAFKDLVENEIWTVFSHNIDMLNIYIGDLAKALGERVNYPDVPPMQSQVERKNIFED